ncbi:signal transduction histidine kinase [Bradyrhizobium sp. S3.9.2]|uniref:MASE4 domain-containing protein n=1 Tax=Bradyrhizobium sp. S3.9.2 TaxID=3156432 RepID=UPI003394D570
MDQTAPTVLEEQRFILSALSPSLAQRRLALAVMIALILAFLVTAGPLSTFQPGRIDAFVPIYATALFVTDLITAVLLFTQFAIVRSLALAVLASGYLLASLVVIPWMLTFPGVFAPSGLLGAGLQTAQWLYNLRQLGFPMFVIAYALLKDADRTKRLWQGSVAAGILSGAALTGALVCAATVLTTAGQALLPHTMLDSVHFSTLRVYIAGCQIGLSVAALIVLWVRLRSVLDLWLMVVMCAYAIEVALTVFPVPVRFSMGFYAGTIYGLISGSLLLFVLLYEITALYGQLLRANLAQRRERDARLMTGDAVAAAMAHEIKQPLTAMITSADAAVQWLDRSIPDIDNATNALKRIAANGHRAGAVIESIRVMFKSDARKRTSLDINELINEAINMLRGDLQKHRISVQTDTDRRVRQVTGDRIQLQQVLLNLIANAIDSMAGEDEPRILSVKSEVLDSGIMVAVADSGKGIASQDLDRIFNPLFTTKSDGMGMGLSICRSIIEAHGGRLSATRCEPRGALFQFTIPAD